MKKIMKGERYELQLQPKKESEKESKESGFSKKSC